MSARIRWWKDAWWVVVHLDKRRTLKRFGPTKEDRRRAERAAEETNHRIALRQYTLEPDPGPPEPAPVPFDGFAKEWVRREVQMPIERELARHLAPETARSYDQHVRVHLSPFFGERDVRTIDVQAVQGFVDRCADRGSPKSGKTIDRILQTLRLILAKARAQRIVATNAVEEWKRERPRIGRRRSALPDRITPAMVLSGAELDSLLQGAQKESAATYGVFLFMADTGARIGEATALRWSDVDLVARTARIERSFSGGRSLGPTKTGRTRVVELSTRLQAHLERCRPDIFTAETLAFPSADGTLVDPSNFRRTFERVTRRALGEAHRRVTPHTLRHTFASLHLARGTNLLWVQQQGGWLSPHVLLTTYAHFVPSELRGFADALSTAPDGTRRHQATNSARVGAPRRTESRGSSPMSADGIEPSTGGLRVLCSTD